MNPDTNRFEVLYFPSKQGQTKLLRPDGSEVPKHWAVFSIGELVVIKDYTFKVAYINDGAILFEPVGPQIVGEEECCSCGGHR